jgi:hypothetical protein
MKLSLLCLTATMLASSMPRDGVGSRGVGH